MRRLRLHSSVEVEILSRCRRGTIPTDEGGAAGQVTVYRPDAVPLQVVAVLHGKRDLAEGMKGRSVGATSGQVKFSPNRNFRRRLGFYSIVPFTQAG